MVIVIFVVFVGAILMCFLMTKEEKNDQERERTLKRLGVLEMQLKLLDSDLKQGKITKEEYLTETDFVLRELDSIEDLVEKLGGK